MELPDHAWQQDTVWTRSTAPDLDAATPNVLGVVLIPRYPAGHPLAELACGVFVVRVAGEGRGRTVWYN